MLFRKEALNAKTNKGDGEILLSPKFSHILVLFLIVAWVIAVFIWLFNTEYSRKQTVLGWLEPNEGILHVYAEFNSQNSGFVSTVLVDDGDYVDKGAALFSIEDERNLVDGEGLERSLLLEYNNRKLLLEERKKKEEVAFFNDLDIHKKTLSAAKESLELMRQQEDSLKVRYRLKKERSDKIKRKLTDSYTSLVDIEDFEDESLSVLSQLQTIQREKSSLRNEIEILEAQLQILPVKHNNNLLLIKQQISDNNLDILNLSGKKEFLIKSPISGVVANSVLKEGYKPRQNLPVLSIVPLNSYLKAYLIVPVDSIAFIEIGQEITVRYDAFPYQKFGLYSGEITEISPVTLSSDSLSLVPIDVKGPVYRVSATLNSQSIDYGDRTLLLRSGMTLSADIKLGSRTLLEWLLDPILSTSGRL